MNWGASCRNVRNFAQGLKFKADFHSKMGVSRHELKGSTPTLTPIIPTLVVDAAHIFPCFIQTVLEDVDWRRINGTLWQSVPLVDYSVREKCLPCCRSASCLKRFVSRDYLRKAEKIWISSLFPFRRVFCTHQSSCHLVSVSPTNIFPIASTSLHMSIS